MAPSSKELSTNFQAGDPKQISDTQYNDPPANRRQCHRRHIILKAVNYLLKQFVFIVTNLSSCMDLTKHLKLFDEAMCIHDGTLKIVSNFE